MRIAELPTRMPARLLDRMNVGVVRWRLSQDRDRAAASPPGIASLPDGLRLARRERRGGLEAEHWVSGSSDWVATRLPVAARAPAGALVFLHGWLATPLHVDYLAWRVRRLVEAGIEVWLPRLPAHIERTPPGAVSGSRCLLPDVQASAAMVRTAASETNVLGTWLRNRHARVALWGISLGGWVAAVAATRSVDWDGLVLWSPVVDPLTTMRESPLAAASGAAPGKLVGEVLAERLRDVIPIEGLPARRDLPVLIVSGSYDDVAFPASVQMLAKRWGASIVMTRHGHISMMVSPRAWRAARRFVVKALVANQR